jgi:hypothetical protein
MKTLTQLNVIQVQTHDLSSQLTDEMIANTSKGLSLFYNDGRFYYQTFFTLPTIGEINRIDGIHHNGQVNFRAITKLGPMIYHVRCSARENDIRSMIENEDFYKLIHGIDKNLQPQDRSRRFLDLSTGKEQWNLLCSTQKKQTIIMNYTTSNNHKIRLTNIITLNNKLLGISKDNKVYMGTLTPEIFEKTDNRINVEPVETINQLGKVDLISQIPNTDEAFLVSVGNNIYEFTLWGDVMHFQALEDTVKRINSINFNNTRGIVATNSGLYEMDVLEIPNMVKPYGLPKQIVNPLLKKEIEMALYVEDPEILGMHSAVGVITKTANNNVLFF